MIMSITGGETFSQADVLRFTRKFIKDKIEKLEGVAAADISGGVEREILVEIDKGKIKGLHIDLLEISKAMKNANLNYPAGTTKEKFYEYLIRTIGEFAEIDEIAEIPIAVDDQEKGFEVDVNVKLSADDKKRQERGEYKRLVLLKDVSTIHDTFKEKTSYSRYNGNENISIAVQKQSAANVILTAERVKKAFRKIKEHFRRA